MNPLRPSLRILFLVSAHNGLSQRAWIALTELGHDVAVAVVDSAAAMEAAVDEHDPQLIVCPFLKKMIPESIWSTHRCLIVHPGPVGDRGPSSLDWAIELGARDWGVTVLAGQRRARRRRCLGDPRASAMREAGKSSLYRHEVRHAAIEALVEAIGQDRRRRAAADEPLDSHGRRRRARPAADDARTSARSTGSPTAPTRCCARSAPARAIPGVLDAIEGAEFHPVRRAPRTGAARPARARSSRSGTARSAARPSTGRCGSRTSSGRDTAAERYFKLPATRALALAGVELDAAGDRGRRSTRGCRRTTPTARSPTRSTAAVGYLHFDFYNGAMSTEQCRGCARPTRTLARGAQTKVIVLMGGSDYFSNGIHLNVIEAAEDPARGVVAQPQRDRRSRARHRRDRLAPRHLRARRRRRSRRRAVGARRRLRGRARGRRSQPVLPAHGRPLRIGVLDLPAAAPGRRRR